MPSPLLEPVAPGVFTVARPLTFLGLEMGTRMTVIQLGDGRLLVHSPVSLDEPLHDAVAALGEVSFLVAPTLFHHLYVAPWRDAFPSAALWCCPGLERKRTDIAWTSVLADDLRAPFGEEIDHVVFGARSIENEAVLFHRPTRTIVSSDLVFDFGSLPSRLTRLVGALIGNRTVGATMLERLTIRDRPRARRELDRMIAWEAERIVIAHGSIVREGGSVVIERAFAFVG